jgi:hypothetical protein
MKRLVVCCLALAALALAWAGPSAGNEVTIKGMVLNNVHTGEDQTCVFVYALDGTPEDQGKADRNRKHGHFGRGNGQYAVSEIEYIGSDAGPEKTYPGITRFRVVVEGP